MSDFLFVYGTLQAGHAPSEIAHAVEKLRHVGRGSIAGVLYDLGEYPGAISSESGGKICGEVVELPPDPSVLQQLDEYEGFTPASPAGSLFVRTYQPVRLDSGETLNCWVYIYNRDPGTAPVLPQADSASLVSLTHFPSFCEEWRTPPFTCTPSLHRPANPNRS